MTKAVIVIPARMASTRFPGKPLARIAGIPMIERVWQIAQQSKLASRVVISTDDENLADHVSSYAEVIMTCSECKTGTDRVAKTLEKLDAHYDIIFSLQGDAVLTPPWIIDDVLNVMIEDSNIQIATPAVELQNKAKNDFIESKLEGSTTGTSVVFDQAMNALYFSKALIPHARDNETRSVYRHIGLYGYRNDALLRFNNLEQTPFEKIEHLEQLRALESGIPIRVVLVDYKGRTHGSVDSKEDVQVVENIIQQEGELF